MASPPSHLDLGGVYCYITNHSETVAKNNNDLLSLTVLWGWQRPSWVDLLFFWESLMKGSKGWNISHVLIHTSSSLAAWLEEGNSLSGGNMFPWGSSGFPRDGWTPRGGVHSKRQKRPNSLDSVLRVTQWQVAKMCGPGCGQPVSGPLDKKAVLPLP